MKEWSRTIFTIVGSVVGAGFISGRELLRFFGGTAFLPYILTSGVLFFVYLLFLLRVGNKYGGFEGYLQGVFGKFPIAERVVRGVFILCSLIVVTAMLAGIDALAPSFAPYISLLSATACFFIVRRGIDGVGTLNTFLVPVMLTYLGVQLFLRGEFSFSLTPEHGLVWIWAYVAMNMFLASSVVMDCGKTLQSGKTTVTAALVSSVIICFFVGAILSAIGGVEEAKEHTMPVLYLLKNGKFFALISYFGIVTTLISSYYPMHVLAGKVKKGKDAVRAGILLFASLCARAGLEKIVEYAYPLMGFTGILFLTVVVLHDELFQKRDQKIHDARQQTQNKRRRHYQI